MSRHSFTTLPTIKCFDGEFIIYEPQDTSAHYFNEEVYANIMALSPEEKDLWFRMHRDNEDLFTKMYTVDQDFLYVMGEGYSLARAERMFPAGIDEDELIEEYREWLKKQ